MGRAFLENTFIKVLENGDKVFVPYIMAGDGGVENLTDQLLKLENYGATAIEIGIPFSDPVADGPTIQEAGKRALQSGATLSSIFDHLKLRRREVKIPIIFMTYMNPIFHYNIERFVSDCVEAGVDALIIPDLPMEHYDLIGPQLKEAGVALIQLATLTSPLSRLEAIAKLSEGFLYAVTINGTTGAREGFDTTIEDHLKKLKAISPVPVLAGFGISQPEHVRELSSVCDGVVVGSRIIDLLQKNDSNALLSLIQSAKMTKLEY
jgi:tryptophan synthase alpha chain